MPRHLLCFPYSITYNLRHSVLCPLSLVHLPSSVISALHHPHFRPLSSVTLITSLCMSPNSLPLHPILLIIFPTSVHYSLPPHSNFIYLTFYPLWFVVYPSACNCCPLLPTQSPPSLPQSPTNLSPDNTIPLCLPCLSPPKLRMPLFLSKGTTHKLKPSPYPYAAVFCNLSITLCALHSTPLTFPSAPPGLRHSFDLVPSSFRPLFHSAFIPSLPQHSVFHPYYS